METIFDVEVEKEKTPRYDTNIITSGHARLSKCLKLLLSPGLINRGRVDELVMRLLCILARDRFTQGYSGSRCPRPLKTRLEDFFQRSFRQVGLEYTLDTRDSCLFMGFLILVPATHARYTDLK